MSSSVAKINIAIAADPRQFESGMNRVDSRLSKLSSSVKETSPLLKNMFSGINFNIPGLDKIQRAFSTIKESAEALSKVRLGANGIERAAQQSGSKLHAATALATLGAAGASAYASRKVSDLPDKFSSAFSRESAAMGDLGKEIKHVLSTLPEGDFRESLKPLQEASKRLDKVTKKLDESVAFYDKIQDHTLGPEMVKQRYNIVGGQPQILQALWAKEISQAADAVKDWEKETDEAFKSFNEVMKKHGDFINRELDQWNPSRKGLPGTETALPERSMTRLQKITDSMGQAISRISDRLGRLFDTLVRGASAVGTKIAALAARAAALVPVIGTLVASFGILIGALGSIVKFVQSSSESILAAAKGTFKTGISYRDTVAFQTAAGNYGVDPVTASALLDKFALKVGQARMGTGEALPTFNALGIDVNSMSNGEAFRATMEGLRKLGDQATKTALGARIFEEEFARISPIVNTNLETMAEKAEEAGLMHSKAQLGAVLAAEEARQELASAWQGLKETLAVELAPAAAGIALALSDAIKGITSFVESIFGVINKVRGWLGMDPIELDLGFAAYYDKRKRVEGGEEGGSAPVDQPIESDPRFQRVKALYESTITPAEQLAQAQADLNWALQQGVMGWAEYNRAMAKAQENFQNADPAIQRYKALVEETLTPLERFRKAALEAARFGGEVGRRAYQKALDSYKGESGLQSVLDEIATPLEKAQEKIRKLQELLRDGALTWEQYARAVGKATEELSANGQAQASADARAGTTSLATTAFNFPAFANGSQFSEETRLQREQNNILANMLRRMMEHYSWQRNNAPAVL